MKTRLKQFIIPQRVISRRMTCYEPLKSTLMLEKENDEVIIDNRVHNFEHLLVDA